MKIIFFCRLFYPHIGGVEKHVLEISKRLIKKNYKVIVVAEKHAEDLKNYEIFKGIEVHRIPLVNNSWFKKIIIWFWFLKHLNLIQSADIIHCHDVTFWFFPFKFIFPNKPLYTTFHGYESFPISKKAIIVRKISELISWGNICIGDFMKKWYGTKPTFVSYGGVTLNKNNNRAIKDNSAVFIGRLDNQTGILTYLKAFEKIRKNHPNFKFTVLGDGLFKKRVEKKVNVLGFKKNPETFLSTNRFAFVSRYLSILEAMAAKRLIFAVYDNPVKEDYLRITPFYKYIIAVSSAEELTNKILDLMTNDKKEKEIIDNAFNWVKTQSWEKVTDLYIKLWKKVT